MNKHQNKNDQRLKSEKEDENEQIQNGGATIIFKECFWCMLSAF
jgi:hypothetical protein